MQRIKEYLPSASASTRQNSKQSIPSMPYDQMPVALRSQHMRPFSQIFHNSQYSLARKQKVRDITSQTLERDFQNTHHLQQQRENQLLKSFKVRCKRKEDRHSRPETNEDFFMGLLRERQAEQRKLDSEYLATVREEMKGGEEEGEGGFDGREKRICEYNIIYDYRAENLPNPFK